MKPEDALESARAAAASLRHAGAYEEETTLAGPPAPDGIDYRQLIEWAVISPDIEVVYSTRRHGALLTAFKRLLVRLLAQYHGEVTGQQSRFNAALLRYVRDLEQRVRELEQERAGARDTR